MCCATPVSDDDLAACDSSDGDFTLSEGGAFIPGVYLAWFSSSRNRPSHQTMPTTQTKASTQQHLAIGSHPRLLLAVDSPACRYSLSSLVCAWCNVCAGVNRVLHPPTTPEGRECAARKWGFSAIQGGRPVVKPKFDNMMELLSA